MVATTRCSIARSLEVLGERWTLLILREAFLGRTRFGEFSEALGISTDLLTNRLNTLVDGGVLEKRPVRAPGQRVWHSYHLTEAGEQLRLILGALQQWGDNHRPHDDGPSYLRRRRSTGELLDLAFVTPEGRPVPVDDVVFEPAP